MSKISGFLRNIFGQFRCKFGWFYVSYLKNQRRKFEIIYKANLWNNSETYSGDGSTLEYTKNIINELPTFFEKMKISSIFDAPCGDYNWFKYVKRDGYFEYIGGDIVKALIDKNSATYANTTTKFIEFDIRFDDFPQVDLWLCRDCLFHLSNEDIIITLINFSRSSIPYILTTTHINALENIELPKSGFRLLNLQLPPFELPEPIDKIDDWITGYPERVLALWNRQDIVDALEDKKDYLVYLGRN